MKAHSIRLLLFSAIVVVATGCTKILTDFEFEDKDPLLVLHAQCNPDSTIHVWLTRSLDMYDRREIKPVDNASLTLSSEGQNLAVFTRDSAGWYSLSAGALMQGRKYRIEAVADGFPTAASEFTIPVVPEITGIETGKITSYSDYYFGSVTNGLCTIHFEDNVNTEDYYLVSIKKSFAEAFYQYAYDTIPAHWDTSYFNDFIAINSNSPYLELRFAEYENAWYYQDDGWEYKKLIFSDKLFNGAKDATIEVSFDRMNSIETTGNDSFRDSLEIHFSSIDPAYYRYALTKAHIYYALENPLSEPVTPYNTVEGGYGLVYGISNRIRIEDITGLFKEVP